MHSISDTAISDAPLLVSFDSEAHQIEVTTVDLAGLRSLGRFHSAADAWRAIDSLDAPGVD